ncbi:translocation/assembly module TamB domain-containing protein [uncultured Cohaesibacter sp.]|uniref:translocation/assembly module TamB domain-containing protein n=1 Tax=uncultured Cohaesibacter sp. TaxID=1002546 RepID=UPI0029C81B11|nr:translocation/assembly module TamB domain-containing protein [uncultured Cohaesibacter sp.]
MTSARTLLFRGLYILLFSILALLLIGYMMLASSFGLSMTASLISRLASNDAQQVEISGVESLLGDVEIGQIALSDKDGQWLVARKLSGHYAPADLFSLALTIDDLTLAELDVIRQPAAETSSTDASSGDGSLIPTLPAVSARIGSFAIDRISLGEAVLGKAADLTLSGNMALDGLPFRTEGTLDIHYLDAPQSGLSTRWDLAPDANRRLLDLDFSEPRGGLAARLIAIADLPAIDVSLKGDGPGDNWTSTLAVKLDGKTTISGQVIVAIADGTSRVNAKLLGKLSPFLPKSILPLVAGTSNVDLQIEQSPDEVISLKQLTFSSGLARLSASGYLDNRDKSLDMAMQFDLGSEGTEIEMQQDNAASLMIGHTGLTGRLKGTFAKAALAVDGSVSSLSQDALSLEGLTLLVSAPELDLENRQGAINAEIALASLSTGSGQLDALVKGNKTLRIESLLDGDSLRLDNANLVAGLASLQAQGRYGADALAIDGSLSVADLKPIDEGLAGSLSGTFSVKGTPANPRLALNMRGQSLSVYDKAVENLKIDLTSTAAQDAQLALSASYDGSPLESAIELVTNGDGSRSINHLSVTAPGTEISGSVSLSPQGLATGDLAASISDLAALGPLLLQPDLKGSLKADITLAASQGKQSVTVAATSSELAIKDIALSALQLNAQISDATGMMSMNSALAVDRIVAQGETIRTLKAEMSGGNGTLPFAATASISRAPFSLKGKLLQQNGQTAIALEQFQGNWKSVALALADPVNIDLTNGAALQSALKLKLDSGLVTVSGSAGEQLALDVVLSALPLAIAEKISPTGETPTGQLDLTAKISGSSASPVAHWQGKISDLSVRSTRDAGLPRMAIDSSGQFENDTIRMKNHLTGGGADLDVNGSVALKQQSMNISAGGSVPFSLAARSLANAGLQLDGSANVQASITGRFASPDINGTITTKGARFSEFSSGIILRELGGTIRLEGQQALIDNVTGRLGQKGTLAVNGKVGIDTNAGLPADISVSIQNGSFKYEEMLTSLFNASMNLKGELTGTSTISGDVDLKTTEIMIPEKLPSSLSPVDVTHKNAQGRVAEQAKKFAPADVSQSSDAGPAMLLDLNIRAPRSIYVRGRGMDAELGGTIRIGGTTAAPRPLGTIAMQRGRLEILTKRLDFDSGDVTFTGTLDPALDFSATTTNSGTTYTVAVTGYASAPEISLTSSPTLPEDEILAHLFFDKELSELSAIQLAQLANAVATLSGVNSGPGVLDRLRSMAGIDNIDIKSDADTNETTVGVGRYINDRTYINVEKSTASDAGKVSIDLDITDQIKAHGEASSDGETKAGIFFERDY